MAKGILPRNLFPTKFNSEESPSLEQCIKNSLEAYKKFNDFEDNRKNNDLQNPYKREVAKKVKILKLKKLCEDTNSILRIGINWDENKVLINKWCIIDLFNKSWRGTNDLKWKKYYKLVCFFKKYIMK